MKNKHYLLPLLIVTGLLGISQLKAQTTKPNIIVIFADDLGYGDLGVYGHPTIQTPNLDRMAFEGQKWTNFYVAAPVCTPSRAALMTGRLPVRTGMSSEKRRVLFPDSKGGLPQTEITIGRKLKEDGYHTAAIGKWHLGHLPEYLPNAHGFDYYFGIPYSNDMDRIQEGEYFEVLKQPQVNYFNVPLIQNTQEIERPVDQTTITKRYTEEAVKFIEENKEQPFFLYLAHSMPHVPLFASTDFEGGSPRGLYGDVLREIDWSVGEVLKTLKENGIDENTLVVFTSDNGPWLIFEDHGGSAGLLRGGKGGTFDGGMRVPAIFRWPGKISPGVVLEIGSTLDLFPTFVSLTRTQLPTDRIYDGYDLSQVLLNGAKSPREEIYYYRDTEVYAVRKGSYKVHFVTQNDYGSRDKTQHTPALLYNLDQDPSEKYNINQNHPQIIQEIQDLLDKHTATLEPVVNQLER
jgi:arylsulfatase A